MRLSPGRSIRLAGIAFLLWATAYNVTAPLLPLFAKELGAAPVNVGLVGAASGAGAVLLVLPISYLSDRVGRHAGMICGWAVSAIGMLLMASARSWQVLLPGAFLSLGVLATLPTLNVLLLEQTRPHERVRGFSLLYGAGPLGLLIGSPVGGAIAQAYGLRTAVLVAGVCCLVAVAFTLPLRLMPPAPADTGTGEGSARGTPTLVLLAMAAVIAGGFLFLSLPGNFMVPYLHEVRGQSFMTTGFSSATLAAAQLAWSLLFAVWPRGEGRLLLRVRGYELALPRSILLAVTTCLAANALFGLLFTIPLAGFGWAGLLLRGSQYTLQGLGSALAGAMAASGKNQTTRLTLVSVAAGIGAAGAPIVAGWLYVASPAYPFWLAGVAAACGTVILGAALFLLRPGREKGVLQAG